MTRAIHRQAPILLILVGLVGTLGILAWKTWQAEQESVHAAAESRKAKVLAGQNQIILNQRTPLFSTLQSQNRELRRKVDHLTTEVGNLKQSEDRHATDVETFMRKGRQ